MGTKELGVRLERLSAMQAAYFCSLDAASPEEDAMMMFEYAQVNNLFSKTGARLFGRNTYPVDKPGTHDYEVYLTLGGSQKENIGGAEAVDIPSGLYAALRFKNLENIWVAWKKLRN